MWILCVKAKRCVASSSPDKAANTGLPILDCNKRPNSDADYAVPTRFCLIMHKLKMSLTTNMHFLPWWVLMTGTNMMPAGVT